MNKMELYNYYNLDECTDRKKVLKELKSLEKEGKIDYSIDGEILKLDDLDLDELEVENLSKMFEKYDVFPEPDKFDDDEDDFYDDFGDYDDDY